MANDVDAGDITLEELQLATRNHGTPLEAMQWPITPVGLHYLLIHYDIPLVDPVDWRLTVDGCVRRPLLLSLAEIRSRPTRTVTITMECAGNGRAQLSPRPLSQPWIVEAVGTAQWTGTPLAPLLAEAGMLGEALGVVFTGLDRGIEGGVEQSYARSLSVEEASSDDVLLAYEVNGVVLPPQHGFPLRVIVPGWYGMTNVKWLSGISVISEPFDGYQQSTAYRLREHEDEPGSALTRMTPRALMVPPGIPDFFARRRFLTVGRHVLVGRAWSGHAPIERVEVSFDGGTTWQVAALDSDVARAGVWRGWSLDWDATTPGDLQLSCRARDAEGNEQANDPTWNLGGYANNSIQRIPVTVREAS